MAADPRDPTGSIPRDDDPPSNATGAARQDPPNAAMRAERAAEQERDAQPQPIMRRAEKSTTLGGCMCAQWGPQKLRGEELLKEYRLKLSESFMLKLCKEDIDELRDYLLNRGVKAQARVGLKRQKALIELLKSTPPYSTAPISDRALRSQNPEVIPGQSSQVNYPSRGQFSTTLQVHPDLPTNNQLSSSMVHQSTNPQPEVIQPHEYGSQQQRRLWQQQQQILQQQQQQWVSRQQPMTQP
eukprot:Plantae.Rhodophyta-Hildenbrandia_rubra.ctg8823.p2 GENE.Plantae.Rhodophyta-Hildenbrandia_rubra.ctg8823~~Plantae.Rhodophyta-Hildenbrandia_rubra.ctg8823.p2  ORF type:complete len:241 (+),score=32.60 Plantae.Rhodophyta-Hildenbrandia_rubra.ctg8823:177-899(+)